MGVKPRVLYFDVLSIVASLAVIFLHCNGIVHWGPATPHWSQALVVEVAFYWAVPIFFMCSGAKTLGYRDRKDTRTFLLSRMKGIFFPFVAWCAIQYVIRASGLFNPLPEGWEPSPAHFLRVFMNGQIDGTYWFFFAMFGVTLSIPVLSRLKDHIDTLWYLVGAYILLSGTITPLCKVLGLPWNESISISVSGGYVMYTVLGYLLASDSRVFASRSRRCLLYGLGIIGLMVRYGFTWMASQRTGVLNNALFEYNYLTAILPSAAVFVWFKQVDWEGLFARLHVRASSVRRVAGLTFGVYLMHYLVLNEVFIGHLSMDMTSYAVRLGLPWVIFTVCLACSYALNRIPFARALVGGWR
ncbi:acyltransferase [Collinsella sp. zg1085]|uniref:acyltransferase n=1 Tax=Collinsella sp. zg1085 TaxID=2844380 RepID=UPI001C0B529C|nr:acyltransferase [Collinsella sp. zg1085]QWT17562.1 acyltransferase [Collinsella sp. zg1085]